VFRCATGERAGIRMPDPRDDFNIIVDSKIDCLYIFTKAVSEMTDKVGKKTRFSINVTQVPVEGKRFEFLIDPRWIEEQLSDCEIFSPFEDGRLHLMVSPVGENYHLKGEAHLAFKMTCVRCLRDVVVSLSVPLSIVTGGRGRRTVHR
jgi:hypothetical protein